MTVMDLTPAGRGNVTTPGRTLEQRMDALARGNRIRMERAALKKEIAAGRMSACDILERPPWFAQGMRVSELLTAIPRVGRVKARKVMVRAVVAESKTVGGATLRQREALIEALR